MKKIIRMYFSLNRLSIDGLGSSMIIIIMWGGLLLTAVAQSL